ncbi:MAG: branched-chain amino acid ABC transporter ATP-binding protein/permease [Proteobacteria bacterium]|nr:branched-chain amino acid ABC transporter ATP-binding protein/permease [Pseudomonadota bacterium]
MSPRHLFVAFVVLVAAAPALLPEFTITLLGYIGLYALVALGLVLLTGIGGLTSFGQAAFVGLGAYTTAVLTTATTLPPWLAWIGSSTWFTLVAGLLLTLAFALAIGALTLRLSGHYLPLSTIAWGISLYFVFGNLEPLGGFTGISGVPPISIFGHEITSSREMFYLIWLFLLAAIVTTRNLLDSREGRAIRALRGGRVMAEAMGVNTARSRLAIFVLAALQACVSGWLYAHMQRFLNPTPFSINMGIEYLFMAVVGGAGEVWGALLGAAVITVSKQWLQDTLPQLIGQAGNFEAVVFGIAMVIVLQRARDGLWPLLARWVPLKAGARTIDAGAAPLRRRARPVAGERLLEVEGATMRFGGLVAVDGMALEVGAGEIVALIGPNGAGKSTTFNVVSGVLEPSAGSIRFRGTPIAGRSSREIAALGMSRTFQHVKLLPRMSVLDNVAIGAHARDNPGLLRGMLAGAWRLERRDEARLLAEAARQIERVGLGGHLHDAAGALPLGKQRLLEVARALAADPCLLLLDEPAAGLRLLEKRALADLLRKLEAEGIAILLVEHDMDFVMGLVDRVYVMDFGQKICEGAPEAVQRDARVLEAYLGVP